MLLQVTTALLSLSTLSSALPARDTFQDGQVIIGPSQAFQIFQAFGDASVNLGGNSVPSDNTTIVPPPVNTTTVVPPTASTTMGPPPVSTTTMVPPSASTTMSPPPASTTMGPPPASTTIVPPPVNTTTPLLPVPTTDSTSNSTTTPPSNASIISIGSRDLNPRGIPFQFKVSRGPNGTNQQDLVVSFDNLPCPPASRGAYSFEFNFIPEAQYTSSGEGQIKVYKINGPLPIIPTYNTIQPITGSHIGTFQLPRGAEAQSPKLIFINQLVCEPTINLRFGLADENSRNGTVSYFNSDGMGLRERSGL